MNAVESVPALGAALPPISARAALAELQLEIGLARYHERNNCDEPADVRASRLRESLARAHALITLLVRA